MRTHEIWVETAPRSRRRAATAGGLSWRLGLLAALCGLVVCLRRPWTTDDLPGVWPYADRKPPGNAFGSVQALAANEHLGRGWPADSLHGVLLVTAIWTLVLLASVAVAFMAGRRAPWLHGRAARWLSVLA